MGGMYPTAGLIFGNSANSTIAGTVQRAVLVCHRRLLSKVGRLLEIFSSLDAMAAYDLPLDIGKRFDPLTMDPKEFMMPDLFTCVGDKMYHKFDEIYLFYSDAAGSMVVSFYLRGKQVYWEPVNMGSFRGELRISDLLGWQAIKFV